MTTFRLHILYLNGSTAVLGPWSLPEGPMGQAYQVALEAWIGMALLQPNVAGVLSWSSDATGSRWMAMQPGEVFTMPTA